MRQTEYRRKNAILNEEIFEDIQKVSQAELNWLFRQVRYKIRRIDRYRSQVVSANPRLQKSYIVSGDLWAYFVERMKTAVMKALMRGVLSLFQLQQAHLPDWKPVEFSSADLAKLIEPEVGERIVGVTDSIKRLVGRRVLAWYNSPGTTMQSLVDQLKDVFGESRERGLKLAMPQ
jgi:hypothetical protein